MTMRVSYIGVFRRGARTNLDKYYDRPFDIFDSYYEMFEGGLPSSWVEKLGRWTQMDWGSYLYVCDKKQMKEIVGSKVRYVKPVIPAKKGETMAKILPSVPLDRIPVRQWYGVMEVEVY